MKAEFEDGIYCDKAFAMMRSYNKKDSKQPSNDANFIQQSNSSIQRYPPTVVRRILFLYNFFFQTDSQINHPHGLTKLLSSMKTFSHFCTKDVDERFLNYHNLKK